MKVNKQVEIKTNRQRRDRMERRKFQINCQMSMKQRIDKNKTNIQRTERERQRKTMQTKKQIKT